MLVPYNMPTQTYVAGARTTQTLRDLPKTYLGKITHVVKFIFSVNYAPTWATSGPDTVGSNNVFTSVDFYDGSYLRFQGGFNHMRAKERISLGHPRYADPSTVTASTTARNFTRVLHVGPPQFANYDSDFMIPCGALENGELRMSHGALSDLAGNGGGTVSAATGTVRITAMLQLADEVRIPPAYQFINQAAGVSDVNLAGRALYESIFVLNSASFDAITAGDFGAFRLDFGTGDLIGAVKSKDLTAAYLDAMEAGEVAAVTGDTDTGADANEVQINRAAPTALTTPAHDLQPVYWSGKDAYITKMQLAESVVRLRWDGTQSTAQLLIGRILPQGPSVVSAVVARAIGRLNVRSKGAVTKTISKVKYSGLLSEFMPLKVMV